MRIEEREIWIEKVREGKSFLLISHINPDGDTVGSVLGLRLALLDMGKEVQIVCDGEIPKNMRMLTGFDAYLKPDEVHAGYDTAIAVDISSPELMGDALPLYEAADVRMVLDHHPTNTAFGLINWIRRGEAACCQLVYEAIIAFSVDFTPEIADCILLGLSTDTGHFQFSSTTGLTMRTASELIDLGADNAGISKMMYRTKSPSRLELTRIVYRKMRFACDGQIGIIELTNEDFEQAGCSRSDTDGIVNLALEMEGVRFAYMVTEQEKGIKVSLRANRPDTVNDVAVHFGGGGHTQAAGCKINEPLETASAMILEALRVKVG